MKKKKYMKQERELAVQCLYQIEFHQEMDAHTYFVEFFKQEKGFQYDESYTKRVIQAVVQYKTELNELLEGFLKKDWTLSRLPLIEATILRTALAEMLYLDQPPEIAINEAIELTRMYSDEASTKYINGVLHNIAEKRLPANG